ncbi:MAG: restriction endonuclease subunit S [Gammaproteobacteria bacterium]|nr:restriction endonuclease subunit S [Gammaproteobacteria bacterium]
MGKYQAYPEFKESEVEWLGEIPPHWFVLGLGKAVEFMNNGSSATQVEESEDTVRVTRIETISEGVINLEKTGHVNSRDISERFRLKMGDIQFSNINSLSMVGNCALYSGNELLYAGMNLLHMRPNINWVNSKYMLYQFKTKGFRNSVEANAKPAINQASIPTGTLKLFKFLCPPINEQQQIANFLDHETAKIDTLIEKQQQLIKLLKEKRQAVISHAVTKGLNPNAPMRDSGVEWLGEVPAHWVVRRLKHAANIQSGIPKGKDLTGKIAISVPMLRVANVQDGFLNLEDIHQIEIEPDQLERYSLQYGDVLMNEGGDNDKLGRGAVWKEEISPCIHQNHVFAIRPVSIEPQWLDVLTRASYAKFYFFSVAKQSTNLASISSSNIKETPLLIPSGEERKKIMDYVQRKIEVFDKLESKCVAQVMLLRERRTALISAAVTGKIDVRSWIAPEGAKTDKEVAA